MTRATVAGQAGGRDQSLALSGHRPTGSLHFHFHKMTVRGLGLKCGTLGHFAELGTQG